jgi:hypothetical protein
MLYDYLMILLTFTILYLRFFMIENDTYTEKYIEESESDTDPVY